MALGGDGGRVVPVSFILDVHIIVTRGSDVLFLQRKNTGYRDGFFSLVGGHVEQDEAAPDAAARELAEETGLRIEPARFRLVHVLQKFAASPRLSFFLEGDLPAGQEPRNAEPDRCARLAWAPLQAPPAPTIPYISFVAEKIAAGEAYSTFREME
jgi:8-oxo-dGTP pyrophosphatase MutT (NUDIX family)